MNEGNNSMTRIGRSILLFCILFQLLSLELCRMMYLRSRMPIRRM